jgi:2-polyprenyl-6-methoxyphenol hydroxylase-like FAD-dependent oxidoreductase
MHMWPTGFIVTGDAFNPIYGQGMNVSAMDAMTIQQCLQEHLLGTEGSRFCELHSRSWRSRDLVRLRRRRNQGRTAQGRFVEDGEQGSPATGV